MPAAYLTPADAGTRIASYGLSLPAPPPEAILRIASDELDLKGPFLGERLGGELQQREFPRDTSVQDDVPEQVPERILDWVALRAYQLAKDDDAPIKAEKIDKISVSYSRGKTSKVSRYMRNLLRYYRHAAHPIV